MDKLEAARIAGAIVKLDVDESVGFDISKLETVRTTASRMGLKHCRRYVTRADRERRVIEVTRIE